MVLFRRWASAWAGAAAGRQHVRRVAEQALDHPALAVAEHLLAMDGEDVGDRAAAGGCLDLAVGIDERQAEAGGEPLADAALAGAHQANQDNRLVEVLSQGMGRCRRALGAGVGAGLRPIIVACLRRTTRNHRFLARL